MSPDLSPTAAEIADLNDKIDRRLQQRGFGPTMRTVEYRALAAGDGRSVRFAGIDDVQQVTRLVDGAWPTRCDARAMRGHRPRPGIGRSAARRPVRGGLGARADHRRNRGGDE